MCCFIQDGPENSRCPNAAEWRIVYWEAPGDYTEACKERAGQIYTESCTEHVGQLLTDAPEHRVYHISEQERAGYDWLEANYAKAP